MKDIRKVLAIVGAIVAGAVVLPNSSWADYNCGVTRCRQGTTTCPIGYPILSPCTCKCYRSSSEARCQRVIACG